MELSMGPSTKPLVAPGGEAAKAKSLALAGQAKIGEWVQLEAPTDGEYVAADGEGQAKGRRRGCGR